MMAAFGRAIPWEVKRNESRASCRTRCRCRRRRHRRVFGGRQQGAAAAAARGAAPPLETVEVLVAKSDLSRGQVIEAQDIGWQTWPKAAANASFIKQVAIGRTPSTTSSAPSCASSMLAGDPIRGPYVVMAKGSGFMAAILPKGMRAVAVDISAETGAGGFILPDDRVDVVLTRHDKAAEKVTGVEKIVSDTILRNVRVLAVDQSDR